MRDINPTLKPAPASNADDKASKAATLAMTPPPAAVLEEREYLEIGRDGLRPESLMGGAVDLVVRVLRAEIKEAPTVAATAASQPVDAKRLQGGQQLATVSDVPDDFALEANYPNPFNPQTTIRFAIPEASYVRIQVFDLLGREVAMLVDGTLSAGRHEVVFDATSLASGLYVYRMDAGTFEQHRTMLLMK